MRKLCFTFLLLVGVLASAVAQSRKITGKVMDGTTGNGLPDVSVIIAGASTGVQTDPVGNFTVTTNVQGNVKLVFSYVGYTTQTLTVSGDAPVNVVLEKSANSLDDVVVIGYGTAKRKDLTGAISSLSGKELERIPLSSAAEALTGRLPGVQVTTTDGAPGAEIVIRVRGGGSITQDNSPLFIVDGFPVPDINDIAPTDIESIDVLKDASASAIYGARGANGVVIITTKRAKAGKSVVSYNGFYQLRAFPRKLDVLSPYEFTLAQYEYARLRSQAEVDNFQKYFGVYDDLELYKAQKGTDWQDELFGDPPASQQHNVSVTGGNDKTKVSLSYTNNKDEGLMIGSSYERHYLNFKLNHDISKVLKFDFSTRYSNATTLGAGTSGGSSVRVGDAITTRPVNGIADQINISDLVDGATDDLYEEFLRSMINPIDLAKQDYRRRISNVLNMNGGLTWTILKGLSFRSELSLNRNADETRRFWGPLTGEARNVGGNLPLGETSDILRTGFRLANTLTYNFNLGDDHRFTVLAGSELLDEDGNSKGMRSKFFAENITPEKLFDNMGLGTVDRIESSDKYGYSLQSYFGRVNYTLMGKYIFAVSLRADGSSLFSEQNRWSYFPALSAAWRISDEDFLKNVAFVTDLKLRASYGEAGNNRIPINLWKSEYAISNNRTIGFNDVANPYYNPPTMLPNPSLKWETTITRNLGLDFSLFNSRINGSLDAYWNTTKDLLISEPVPADAGYSTQMINIGQTSNKGIELALNGMLINKKDFTLGASFNIGFNRSNIDNLGNNPSAQYSSNWAGTDLKTQDDYRVIVGRTVGLMYGFVTDGWYTTDDFASYDATANRYILKGGVPDPGGLMGGISLRPGLLKLKDIDGDGFITADKDRTIIGVAQPKFSGGFGLNTTYKGFDGSAFFNYVYGNDVYNAGKISYNMYYRSSYGNMLNTMNSDNRYKYIDAGGNLVTSLEGLAELNKDAKIWSPFSFGNASPVFHSYAVEDGSFLRLNNVTLGYSLPRNLISKLSMQRFRIYATVYNAFLWTKYSGYDPEVSATRSSGYSALTPGVDFSGYPKSRTYTAGVNITF